MGGNCRQSIIETLKVDGITHESSAEETVKTNKRMKKIKQHNFRISENKKV